MYIYVDNGHCDIMKRNRTFFKQFYIQNSRLDNNTLKVVNKLLFKRNIITFLSFKNQKFLVLTKIFLGESSLHAESRQLPHHYDHAVTTCVSKWRRHVTSQPALLKIAVFVHVDKGLVNISGNKIRLRNLVAILELLRFTIRIKW